MNWVQDNVTAILNDPAFSEDVVFKRTVSGTYDSATRTTSGGTSETWTAKAQVSKFTASDVEGRNNQVGATDESRILQGDRKLMVLPDNRIQDGVTVTVRGKNLHVVPPIETGPLGAYLVLQVRK